METQTINGKFYMTAEAYIVSGPTDLPRELAAEFDTNKMNSGFVWVAGRYVQANRVNKNGHYWTFDDLQKGEASIRYTPVNAQHVWDSPIGTIVQSKIVHREEVIEASNRLVPEIQVLGAVWAYNFPDMADKIRQSNEKKQLWWSMECVSESKQCLACEEIFPYTAASADTCIHMASSLVAPRRFINPTFLGGALIFPPEKPAWVDAEAELARQVASYANRSDVPEGANEWESQMSLLLA